MFNGYRTRVRMYRTCGFTLFYAVWRSIGLPAFGSVDWPIPIIVICAMMAGCGNAPTAPTLDDPLPWFHNVSATMPDGTIAFVCTTQPRAYIVDNHVTWERDHYITMDRCPNRPID